VNAPSGKRDAARSSVNVPAGKQDAARSDAVRSSVNAPARAAATKGPGKRKSGKTASLAPPVLDFDRVTGADITALREFSGLSVPSFAFRLGVARTTVERWESAPANIALRRESLKKLRALYKKMSRKHTRAAAASYGNP
jgi:DNA-binding transcriptional regulator YiaG